jgi:GNAT superfamily N-acetyltransferase
VAETTETADPKTVFLVARDAVGIIGTVQLNPSWAPNQRHRGDIAKLVVHRRSRRTGLGSQLMQAIEGEARQAGLTLLTLDTKQGDGAEQLYRRAGWIEVGVIPRYALNPDGTMHATVVFYKDLNSSR